jgi:hypothetical protein
VAGLLLALVAVLYFYRADELPRPHGDERAFLNVPFRFANFGDLRYPVFMSESFGAADLRPYPPITALALRSLVVRTAGFSARNSRLVSGVLVLIVVLAAAWWLSSSGDRSPPLLALALAPIALAPVVIIAARSTRLEQETFFFGACSALLLASGGRAGLTRSTPALAAAGVLAAIAAGMHPFGVVYGGLGAIALVATRRPKDLAIWISGAVVGALPTVWWMGQKGRSLIDFAAANGAMYQAREKDLTAWLAQFPSVAWLQPLGLPESVLARVAAVQHGAFSEYIGFPVEPGGWSLALYTLFWVEAAWVARFLFLHLRARRPENDGTAFLGLMALGFLAFTFSYVPNTTYGLYAGFHIHLAFAAVCLAESASLRTTRLLMPLVGLVYVAFGLLSAGRLVQAPKTPSLDEELTAIGRMARASGIRSEDTVMTSTETWIAAGSRNTSLLERIQYGLGSGAHDALVYRRSYVSFYLGAGLPADPDLKASAVRVRAAAMSKALTGMTLSGLLILDHAQKDAIYFFRRPSANKVLVASIDPALPFPARAVGQVGDGSAPLLECDSEPLPLCTFHED